MRRFIALKTFQCEPLKSTYCVGLTYTIRPGNDRLAALAESWARKGWVAFVESNGAAGRMAGLGQVSGE